MIIFTLKRDICGKYYEIRKDGQIVLMNIAQPDWNSKYNWVVGDMLFSKLSDAKNYVRSLIS